MGVTVSIRVQGMGVTVSGYRDGCQCKHQVTGMGVPVSGYRGGCH